MLGTIVTVIGICIVAVYSFVIAVTTIAVTISPGTNPGTSLLLLLLNMVFFYYDRHGSYYSCYNITTFDFAQPMPQFQGTMRLHLHCMYHCH